MTNGIGRFGVRTYVAPATATNPLWDNLLAYYTGDNTPNDAKGTANGTLINGTTYSTGKISNGFIFDGINDFLTMGNVLDFDGSTSFSYSMWVNTNQAICPLLMKIGSSLNTPGYICYILSSKIEFVIQNSNTNRLYVNTVDSIASGWNLINITYDGSKTPSGIKIYVNGVSKTLTTITNTFTSSSSNVASLTFGSTTSSIPYLNGVLDEIAIWNRALTATEVTELYNGGAGKQYVAPAPTIVTNGLVLNLDAGNTLSYAGTGTTWTDLSGNGNNGTLINGTSYSSANSGTMVFDGINDYVSTLSTINGANPLTISCWFKLNTVTKDWQSIVDGYKDVTDRNFQIWVNSNSKLYIWHLGTSHAGDGLLLPNTWYNVVFTYSGSGNGILYLNNSVINASVPKGSGTGGNIPINIGRRADANPSSYTYGNIPQVVIYNRDLSATEVTQNFNALKSRYGL